MKSSSDQFIAFETEVNLINRATFQVILEIISIVSFLVSRNIEGIVSSCSANFRAVSRTSESRLFISFCRD